MKIKKTTPAGVTGSYLVTADSGRTYYIDRCDQGSDLDDGHHIRGFWYTTDMDRFCYEARTLSESKQGILIHERVMNRR